MAATLLGSLLVELGLESGQFKSGLSSAEKELKKTTRSFEKVGQSMTDLGGKLSLAVTAPLTAFGVTAFKAATDARQAFGQVEQALKTMGDASGKTIDQLQGAADRIQNITTFDDDDVLQKVTANMLTFGNVSGEAFDRAQMAAVNLSARLGQDLQSSAIQVGKALNDPIKGVTALSRVGVSFTEQQKAQIKAMAEAGNLAGAQAIILGELEKQYGGAAEAQRKAAPGADLTQQWRTFQEVVGERLVQALAKVEEILAPLLKQFNEMSPAAQTTVVAIGALAAAIGPLLVVLGLMVQGLAPIMAAMSLLGTGGLLGLVMKGFSALVPVIWSAVSAAAAFAVTPLGLVIMGIAAAVAAVYAVWKNWDKIFPVIKRLYTEVKTWLMDKLGAVWDWLKGKIDAVKGWFFGLYDAVVGNSYIPDMVDGIAAEMSRLDAVMVNPAKTATERTKQAFEKLASDVQGIMRELFPEAVSLSDFRDKLAALDKGIKNGGAGGFTVDQLSAARDRLINGQSADTLQNAPLPLVDQLRRFGSVPLGDTSLITAELEKLTTAANDNADKIGATNVRIVQSFKDMAEGTLDAIQKVASAVKGGGILDIVSAVVGLGLQLGSIGAFGKKVQTNINSSKVPGFANGTSYAPGGLAVVGERGPELVNLPRGASVTPNRQLGAMSGAQVQVIPSPYFDVVVNGHIQRAAPTIAGLGAAEAATRANRSSSRRIG